jgi:hypothetical protein
MRAYEGAGPAPTAGDERCLVMVFRSRLGLALVSADPGGEFVAGGDRFRAVSETYLTAFYDRVQDQSGKLVGLEITPVEGAEFLVASISPFEYVQPLEEGRRARIFFAGRIRGNANSSAEQAFGGRVYRSTRGELAISLDLDWLDSSDIRAIKSSPADWLAVSGAVRGG